MSIARIVIDGRAAWMEEGLKGDGQNWKGGGETAIIDVTVVKAAKAMTRAKMSGVAMTDVSRKRR